jgi:hypothetical protein
LSENNLNWNVINFKLLYYFYTVVKSFWKSSKFCLLKSNLYFAILLCKQNRFISTIQFFFYCISTGGVVKNYFKKIYFFPISSSLSRSHGSLKIFFNRTHNVSYMNRYCTWLKISSKLLNLLSKHYNHCLFTLFEGALNCFHLALVQHYITVVLLSQIYVYKMGDPRVGNFTVIKKAHY